MTVNNLKSEILRFILKDDVLLANKSLFPKAKNRSVSIIKIPRVVNNHSNLVIESTSDQVPQSGLHGGPKVIWLNKGVLLKQPVNQLMECGQTLR
ncbi:hypothetical protein Cob_v009519 [Colletotrichum orbiculare MAFF 240422]|uniref:Uncharacterized protein n=1 Tax=Colletotrichum orbiculare (strain 104-T / ATCC 96160 / CBS 514.97 / LARS 414 / MAFF 240422) TaxID=1213857 RepID=A0A484FGV5_COLOR|nr:hypothetical protein Cob_v009519 [Colletotrichum orbiculare MAFF 240422]